MWLTTIGAQNGCFCMKRTHAAFSGGLRLLNQPDILVDVVGDALAVPVRAGEPAAPGKGLERKMDVGRHTARHRE